MTHFQVERARCMLEQHYRLKKFSRAQENRIRLALFLGKPVYADTQAVDYLKQLNLKQLQKMNKPTNGQNPREFYQNLQEQAAEGPLFSSNTLAQISRLPQLTKPQTKFIATQMEEKKIAPAYSLRPVADFISQTNPPLSSWGELVKGSDQWHKELAQEAKSQKTEMSEAEDANIVYKYADGWYVLNLTTSQECTEEGAAMGHCVGGYGKDVEEGKTQILSLRDPKNRPHVTIEVRDGKVMQVYGKANAIPIKYLDKVKEFLGWAYPKDSMTKLYSVAGDKTVSLETVLELESVVGQSGALERVLSSFSEKGLLPTLSRQDTKKILLSIEPKIQEGLDSVYESGGEYVTMLRRWANPQEKIPSELRSKIFEKTGEFLGNPISTNSVSTLFLVSKDKIKLSPEKQELISKVEGLEGPDHYRTFLEKLYKEDSPLLGDALLLGFAALAPSMESYGKYFRAALKKKQISPIVFVVDHSLGILLYSDKSLKLWELVPRWAALAVASGLQLYPEIRENIPPDILDEVKDLEMRPGDRLRRPYQEIGSLKDETVRKYRKKFMEKVEKGQV